MKINLKNKLKNEKIIINCLLIIGIISLLLSMLCEFVIQKYLYFYYNLLHFNYITNVLLGIAGSSIISFICILLPFLDKKETQIKTITSLLGKVYCSYLGIHNGISYKIKQNTLGDNYISDYVFYKNTIELYSHIQELDEEYQKSDIFSSEIDDILKNIKNKLTINIDILQSFFESIIPDRIIKEPNVNVLDKKSAEQLQEQNELYSLLLDKLNSIFHIGDFENTFSCVFDFNSVLNKYMNDSTKKLIEAEEKYLKDTKSINAKFELRKEIINKIGLIN